INSLIGDTASWTGEDTIASKIAATEQGIADNASAIAAEADRATSAEDTLTTGLNDEIDRAKAAEQTLTTNLNNEIDRATKAEGNVGIFKTTDYNSTYAASGAVDLTDAITKVDARATQNLANMGEITEGINITAAPFRTADADNGITSNTIADNLMSLDKIIGNVASITDIDGADVANKLASLNTKIGNAADKAEANAKAYTDKKLSGELDGTVVIGDKADTITIGKTHETVSGEEEIVAGMEIDTKDRTVEIAAQADNGDKAGIDLDTKGITLSATDKNENVMTDLTLDNENEVIALNMVDKTNEDGHVKSAFNMDNKNQTIELLLSDNPNDRTSRIKMDNDDNGLQTIFIGSEKTTSGSEAAFGVKVVSNFGTTGEKSYVEIGDDTDNIKVSEGNLEATGDITSHGNLKVDGQADFGEDGAMVTLKDGNVLADGKVQSATVETGTITTTGDVTVGEDLSVAGDATFGEGGKQVTISDGTVTADDVETKTATVSDTLTVGTVDEDTDKLTSGVQLSSNGDIEATGDITAHGNLQVDGSATFGDKDGANVQIADGTITASDGNGKTVSVGNGNVTASDSVVVGDENGTNVNIAKDGSITSTGANGSEVQIADGSITVTSKDAQGNDSGTVTIKDGKVEADAIDVAGIEADTGAFRESVTVGDDTNGKVTIADGNISALSGEFANSLKLGDDVVSKIDTGSAPVTSDYANADKTLATVATINATVGNAADLTGKNLAAPTTDDEGNTVKPTVTDHLNALNSSIGDREFDNNNVIADGDTVTAALDKIDGALGNVAQFAATDDEGEPTYSGFAKGANNLADAIAGVDTQVGINAGNIGDMNFSDKDVAYGAITATDLTNAVSQINSNIGSADDLGTADEDGNVSNNVNINNSINANIAAVNEAIGDLKGLSLELKNLTNGKDAVEENAPKSVVEALNNLDATLGQIHGLADKRGDNYKGNLAEGTTVEMHLTALDDAIGDRTKITNEKGSNGYKFSSDTMYVADVLTDLASQIGTAEQLSDTTIRTVSAQQTVNQNIAAVNNAIGNVTDLEDTYFVSETTNLTDAVRVLDADMYQLAGAVNHTWKDLKELHHEVRAGMAEMAAMSALVPNPLAHGKTSLSLGTGAYSGHGAVAVGGFHHITDNLMLNAGVAWGNSRDTSYRMGVTYSF
ncbi:MAG: YadA C-terminal domain-containing protein, partial [Alphaproteobacteria bacterium]|nr:YadA C-terminal domain-containing protein [Alphaproteobacteria bacterium]